MSRTLLSCWALLLSSQVASSQPDPIPAHLDTALVYLGVEELGVNAGREVDVFLRSVGLDPGYAWCAAFVSFCLTQAESAGLIEPRIRTAVAQQFITHQSVDVRDVERRRVTPSFGWLVVWKKGNGPYGHVGIVIVWNGMCGVTIEGNTSRGEAGSQRDGDGVFVRRRCSTPGSSFRITHFTPFKYE